MLRKQVIAKERPLELGGRDGGETSKRERGTREGGERFWCTGEKGAGDELALGKEEGGERHCPAPQLHRESRADIFFLLCRLPFQFLGRVLEEQMFLILPYSPVYLFFSCD